jgi:hypothetical protein
MVISGYKVFASWDFALVFCEAGGFCYTLEYKGGFASKADPSARAAWAINPIDLSLFMYDLCNNYITLQTHFEL